MASAQCAAALVPLNGGCSVHTQLRTNTGRSSSSRPLLNITAAVSCSRVKYNSCAVSFISVQRVIRSGPPRYSCFGEAKVDLGRRLPCARCVHMWLTDRELFSKS
eukprot:7897638-Pyramimonas_sp.AAC.1